MGIKYDLYEARYLISGIRDDGEEIHGIRVERIIIIKEPSSPSISDLWNFAKERENTHSQTPGFQERLYELRLNGEAVKADK